MFFETFLNQEIFYKNEKCHAQGNKKFRRRSKSKKQKPWTNRKPNNFFKFSNFKCFFKNIKSRRNFLQKRKVPLHTEIKKFRRRSKSKTMDEPKNEQIFKFYKLKNFFKMFFKTFLSQEIFYKNEVPLHGNKKIPRRS